MRPEARALRALALAVAAALAVPGCCAPAFPLETMRSRDLRTPYDAVDYIRYAVRLEDWDAVRAALSPRSQEMVKRELDRRLLAGDSAFRLFVGGLKYGRLDPRAPAEVAELPIVEIIHRARIVDVRPDERAPGRRWWVQLWYKPLGQEKSLFPLVNAPVPNPEKPGKWLDRWTLGLDEWMEELQAP